ncbi:MAG: DUF423 domain-containing protein [Rhodospirillaceae bacterium]|nr:DUF423 domain-containing protein [Rhodospirillaceae bacterium]
MTLRKSTAAFFVFGALAAGSSVALAAFATHGLQQTMNYPADAVRTFIDATEFQMNQGLAVIVVGLLCQVMRDGLARRIMQVAGVLAAASLVLFSGSVYSSTFGGSAALAPVGGFSAMAGWLIFAAGAIVGVLKGDVRLATGGRPQPAE